MVFKMSLHPILKLKVDELFLYWLSDPDTLRDLKENLKHISRGENVSTSSPTHSYPYKGHGASPASPLLRNGSPGTPPPISPASMATPSPRSPRIRNSSTRSLSSSLSKSQATRLFHEQRQSTSNSKPIQVPQFYFPYGKPLSEEENASVLQRITQLFDTLPENKAYRNQMEEVSKACKCPKYWRTPLFLAADVDNVGYVTADKFITMWKKLIKECHDEASRFFRLLACPGHKYITADDFYPIVQDVVDSHPGLTFLQEAPEFHSRYIHTVIARIFYCINRSWTGRITLPELRKSPLLSVIALLEEEDDINQISEYFSYEHFYVIYCKFWELDSDHDLFIDKTDICRHQDHALSSRMIDRIFSPGTVLSESNSCTAKHQDQEQYRPDAETKTSASASPKSIQEGKMSYTEFVWFLISEEDKKSPVSIEYWFRCMDMDGDGYLSMFELEYFYEEQLQKMESLGIETLPFQDCLCQMLDLVKPQEPDRVSLHDLKVCKLAYIFYDTFFNLEKYLEHEQRDPFTNIRDPDYDGPEPSDWEKFAAEEYEMLVAEEGTQDQQEIGFQEAADQLDEIDYPDDFEPDDEEIISVDLRQKATISELPQRNQWVGNGENGILRTDLAL